MKKILSALMITLALLTGVYYGVRQLQPPPVPKDFVEEAVTLEEAVEGPDLRLMLSYIREMASQVHSVDSEGIRVTQQYLASQLEEMGYTYKTDVYALGMDEVLALQKERADYRKAVFDETEEGNRDYSGIGGKPTMNLTNTYVHVDSPGTDETIIFMAHTDSVKMGPGAFDDIVSVSALLEGMRQLKQLTPVRDILFLFTDGEEQGLLGAAKFVSDHQEFRDLTQLVINIEARGNQGSLLMFETTPDNLGIVTEYSKAVSRPVSFSIATAVYKTMQTDTDLTRFIMEGYQGMNLAVIEGAAVYHTAEDSYQTFSRSSAQHYLDTVTELVNHFASAPALDLEASEDSVHFPLMSGNMVVLSQTTANVVAYTAFILALAVGGLLLGNKKARPGALLASAGLQLAWMAAAGVLSLLIVRLVLNANGLSGYRDVLRLKTAEPIFYLLLGISAVISFILYSILAKRYKSPFSTALGVLLIPAVLALVTTFLFPSVSYLFSLPVLAGLAVVLLSLVFRPGAALYQAPAIFLVLLLYVPIVLLVYVALSFQSAWLSVALAQIPLSMIWGFQSLWAERKQIQKQVVS